MRGFSARITSQSTSGQRATDQGNLAAMERDLIGYGANPPDPKWPGGARLALNFVLNYEEGSEPSVPDGDPASEWGLTENGMLNPGVTGPRPRRRGHVRLRQPRRLLARHAPVRRTQPAADRVRLRPGAGAPSARRRRDPRRRPRHLLPRLALGKALRAVRGRGARAHPPRRRLAATDHGRAPARLVLPLRTQPEHPPPAGRGRRVSLRFRCL